MSKHTVILIRHAQAEHSSSRGDIHRALTEGGRIQCRNLAGKLVPLLRNVGAVLVSPATRAQQTWQEIAIATNLEQLIPETVAEIYGGDQEEILETIRVSGAGRTTVVVGHEPTISATGELISKNPADVPWGVSTATAIVLNSSKDWKEWHPGVGEQVRIIRAD